MPESHDFLKNLALVLCVAAVTTVVFQRLRQPVVLGYLLAGLIVGPHIPVPLVADLQMARTLSELGVILLMFSIGLEFSLGRLARVGGAAALAAVAETSVMMGLGYLTARLLGWTVLESVFTGAIVAISSTTIIARVFSEFGLRGRFTEIVFGILIVEDLIAILLLASLTAIASGGGLSARELGITIARLLVFLAGLIGGGLLVVPRLIRAVVRLDRPETTLITAVGICFAASLLALSLGYSVALGAFIAGSLIAESGQEKAVEHVVRPVRDMFMAIFFVAVGMLIDPVVVRDHWVAVVALSALVITGKIVAATSGVFLAGEGLRTALLSGMSLAQIGEFSFIIAGVGLASGATGDFLYPVAIAVSAITTYASPYLIRAAPAAAQAIDRRLPRGLQTYVALYGSWIERLRTAPTASGGRSRSRRLLRVALVDTALLALLVIGVSSELERLTRLLGGLTGVRDAWVTYGLVGVAAIIAVPLLLGLVRSTHLLGLALAVRAIPQPQRGKVDFARAPRRALEVTLQFALLFAAVALLVAVTQPFVPRLPGVVALAAALAVLGLAVLRAVKNLQGHALAGAEVIAAALSRRMADGSAASMDDTMHEMHRVLPGLGEPVALRVEPSSIAANKSLAELDLRGATGATVLAILRDGSQVVAPDGKEVLRPGDVLAVAGTHDAIVAVRPLLDAPASSSGSD